ncbi:hypothetical protein JW899_03870 [Candidatus Uhrbacteria bacterium]|nr:hypothetical protein [Candidatus Uhrbacteria bacterium]
MDEYIKKTTAFLENAAVAKSDPHSLEEACRHGQKQLENLKHERLIHLLVTLFFAEGVLVTLTLFLFLKMTLLLVIFALFLALLIPYVFHYYFLENTCRRWYGLLREIYERKAG